MLMPNKFNSTCFYQTFKFNVPAQSSSNLNSNANTNNGISINSNTTTSSNYISSVNNRNNANNGNNNNNNVTTNSVANITIDPFLNNNNYAINMMKKTK